ncbi:MAG: PRC-barrel domain-containing protein, partial [Granulosicoccaceae bacterium]
MNTILHRVKSVNLLHTARELGRYTLLAVDGEIGNVEEFYFDDETWAVRYLVVNTGGWLMGRRVL